MAIEEQPLLLIGILVIIATIFTIIARFFKQPPLIAYLITGIIAVPIEQYFVGQIPGLDSMFLIFQKLGLILLLFMAGLEIRIQKVMKHLKNTIILGCGAVFLQAIGIFFIAFYLFGHTTIESFYIGICISLSSTIVVVKALTARKEMQTSHGQVLIAFMIFQDIVALLALALFSGVGNSSEGFLYNVFIIFLKGIATFLLLLLISRIVLEKLLEKIANDIEEIFLAGLAWCFAGVCIAYFFGFSIELGAFIAGATIANLPFSFEIRSKARSLRDFGLLMLFISFGKEIELSRAILLNPETWFYIIFSMVGTWIIINLLANLLGFQKKQAFLLASIPAQISEFSIVLISFGLLKGHVSDQLFSIITVSAIATIIVSSFFHTNLNELYKTFHNYIIFHRFNPNKKDTDKEEEKKDHIVIFGLGELGNHVVKYFIKKKKKVILIDWHPEKVQQAKRMGAEVIFGDAGDPYVWEEVSAESAYLILNTIEGLEDDVNLMRWLGQFNKYRPILIAEAKTAEEEVFLKNPGYDLVLLPGRVEWVALNLYFKRHKI